MKSEIIYMEITEIIIVCVVYFFAGIISVSVGGTSLITVPLLIALGMGPKIAIATNMFSLIFVSITGAIGFRKEIKNHHHKLILGFTILTLIGSALGAQLVLTMDENIIKKVVASICVIIALLLIVKKDLGTKVGSEKISKPRFLVGGILIFILGIYGGFFSGGYVTMLSYVLVFIFGMSFLETAFTTKIFNIFSSLIACVFFYKSNLINFSVGIPIAISVSLGAIIGTKLAIKKGNAWIRDLFIIIVIILAIKLFVF